MLTTHLPSLSQKRSQHMPPLASAPAPRDSRVAGRGSRAGTTDALWRRWLASWRLTGPRFDGGCHAGLCLHVRPRGTQETNGSPVPKSKGLDGPAVPCWEGRRITTQSTTERTVRLNRAASWRHSGRRACKALTQQKKGLLLGDTNSMGPRVRSKGMGNTKCRGQFPGRYRNLSPEPNKISV